MAKRRAATSSGSLNTSETNVFSKGMVKDYTDIFISEGLYTHAVNAINNAHYGESGSIGNEPSNEFCVNATYEIIGFAHKTKGEWVIFSTNNVDSEIGIFNQIDCSYKVVINDPCLAFKQTHDITGVCIENYDCTYSVYWQDNLNPDRTMNLDNVPYICEPVSEDPCDGEVCTNRLDCDKIRLHPLIQQPCLNIKKAKGAGQIPNGSYFVVVAYSENGIRLTDYSMPSIPLGLWRHEGTGSGIEVEISNLDPSYEEYELVIVGSVAQQLLAIKMGNYSISQTKVTIDIVPLSNDKIPINSIPLRNQIYEKSAGMFEVNNYLIRTSVTTQPYFNYQPLANQISTNWVAVKYPKDFYWDGGTITGYLRDEVYSFFIRWVYKTGARSASYHIPGRAPSAIDTSPVATPDVVYPTETEVWQVYDTSSYIPASGSEKDGGEIIAKGQMAYWESTERYPVNTTIWGDLCNEPIRHHKMPSNERTHIHDQGGENIVVLGVEFNNVRHPLDNDGNPIQDIVGYEILRGTREGNRSIISKGLLGNMVEFPLQGDLGNQKKGLFANYPWNDLRPDSFLSPDYTILDNNINEDPVEDAQKLDTYKNDYLSFHSVEASFLGPAIGSIHLKIYTEEYGKALGKFETPYKHPKFKLVTDFAFGVGFVVGLGITLVDTIGKTTMGPAGMTIGPSAPAAFLATQQASRETGSATSISDTIASLINSGLTVGTATNTASIIAGIALFAANASFYLGKSVDSVLDIVRNLSNFRDYYLQYNGHGFYGNYSNVANPDVPFSLPKCIRRNIDLAKYIGSHIQDFDATYRINNLYRQKFLCLKTSAGIPNPINIDNSKKRVADANLSYKSPTETEFISDISGYYAAIKVDYQNQYGQIDTITQIPTDSCIYYTEPQVGLTYSTNTIFGGDVYINRFTQKNPYFFFNTWLYDFIDGTEFDYTLYVNGPAPRYYARFQEFDFSDFGVSFDWNFPSQILPDLDFNTPSDLYRLDDNGVGTSGLFIKRKAWAYLFYSGIKDFYTESELNMAYRNYGNLSDSEKFYDVYGYSFNDLYTMFRSDIIQKPEFYQYDLSLTASRLSINLSKWGTVLPKDYDPVLYDTCFEYYPKRAVYSLQQQSGLKRENWRNYLPLNYKDFNGKITSIKSLNATGAIILFEDKEPLLFTGVDQLQVKEGSTKLTIGDSGLFANNFQAITNADDSLSYGSSISSRSAINTPHGLFFVSQNQGKIFAMAGSGLDEISRNGLKFWFAENLPSQMLAVYPNYPLYDNPVIGIACQAIYDPTYELIYFTKKDYKPLRNDLQFDDENGVPYYVCGQNNPPTGTTVVPEPVGDNEHLACILSVSAANVSYGSSVTLTWSTENAASVTLNGTTPVSLNGSTTVIVQSNPSIFYIEANDGEGNTCVSSVEIQVNPIPIKCPCPYEDPTCFERCDWTASYDPKLKAWISFHDWHPNFLIPSSKHFHTTKGKGIWTHNERWDSYCNYYGTNYPWEVEYPIVTPNNITTLRSVEYTLDVYKFYNNGKDFFHILDENFDRAIIYNSEQISGLLRLTIKGKNAPLDLVQKPTFNGTSIDIFYSKEENKFRFNQFWDITNDRGEFTGTQLPMWNTRCSGYEKDINPIYVDYTKSELEHKKFRHYGNKIILRKNISNDKKMILKLTNAKQNLSPR